MLDYTDTSMISKTEEPKRETVKSILDDMGHILTELEKTIDMISAVVYQGNDMIKESKDDDPCDPPMIAVMSMQREMAEYLLRKAVKIKEVLW